MPSPPHTATITVVALVQVGDGLVDVPLAHGGAPQHGAAVFALDGDRRRQGIHALVVIGAEILDAAALGGIHHLLHVLGAGQGEAALKVSLQEIFAGKVLDDLPGGVGHVGVGKHHVAFLGHGGLGAVNHAVQGRDFCHAPLKGIDGELGGEDARLLGRVGPHAHGAGGKLGAHGVHLLVLGTGQDAAVRKHLLEAFHNGLVPAEIKLAVGIVVAVLVLAALSATPSMHRSAGLLDVAA